jgi:hypothetical protein
MKYLIRFENLKFTPPESRRGKAESIYDDIFDVIQDLKDEKDFRAYVSPIEIKELNSEGEETGNIIRNSASSSAKSLRKNDGTILIIFDLSFNKISPNFDNKERIEIINRIKKAITHIENILKPFGCKFQIEGLAYEDVPSGKKEHIKGYWSNKSWSITNINRLDYLKKIGLRVKCD